MFFEEGWVPLSAVTSQVFRELQGLAAEGVLSGDLKPTLAVSVWDICDACTKIGVTGADGTVIPAAKDLVAWADPQELSNEHINLIAGTVGSSDLADGDGKPPDPEALRRRYGPFFLLPLVVPVNNFQSSMTFLAEEVRGEQTQDDAIVAAARTILTMLKEGDLLTREIARARIGAGLSRRKFKLAWALAAGRAPDLVQPNRWQGL